MAEFPSLSIFTDAFIGDTTHLTAAQTGAYLMLLIIAWRTPSCALPDDDVKLARWARMDIRNWRKNKSIVMAFWELKDDGLWHQSRLSRERIYAESVRTRNVHAGRASALKRLNTGSTTVPTKLQPNSNPHTYTHKQVRGDYVILGQEESNDMLTPTFKNETLLYFREKGIKLMPMQEKQLKDAGL